MGGSPLLQSIPHLSSLGMGMIKEKTKCEGLMGWDRGVPLSRTPPHKQDAPLVPVPPLLPRLQCHRGCTCCRAGAQGHGGRGDTTNPPKPSRMGIRGCGPPPKCEKASAGCRGGGSVGMRCPPKRGAQGSRGPLDAAMGSRSDAVAPGGIADLGLR